MGRTLGRLTAGAAGLIAALLAVAVAVGAAGAQEDAPPDPGTGQLIADGRLVYEGNCQTCHQPDGQGVAGTFPSLLDNPDIQDDEYLRTVIRDGLGGMPGFARLDDAQVTALIVFVQEGLGASTPSPPPGPGAGATTTTTSDDPPSDPGTDRLIADGRLVYEANCRACHQPDGQGVAGTFPPLVDNPDVEDDEYLRTVIRNGLQGEIEALGVTYNGQMPAFPLLDDGQVTALITYLQEGLGEAAPPPPPATGTGGIAGTTLPSAAVLTSVLAFLVVLAGAAIVVGPIVLAPAREGSFTPVQTWLKTGAIVAYFVVATVVLPSMLLEAGFMASPPSVYEDLISADLWDVFRSLVGTALWLVALGLGLWGLRRFQRNKVI